MDRFAVFVDAGYLFTAGSQTAFGTSVSRRQIAMRSPTELVAAIVAAAREAADGLPLLRVYWYDAMPGSRLSLEQSSLALLSGVKLRLGALNSVGEQKGVDSMVVSDLIELSRNGAIADAVLLSGDEDMRIAVQLAQAYGARVHLLAVGDVSRTVSQSLQMEADSVRSLSAEWLQAQFIKLEPQADETIMFQTAASEAMQDSGEPPTLDAAAEGVAAELLDAAPEHVGLLRIHFQSIQSVPPEFDRKLIAKTAKLLNLDRPFSTDEMRRIRGIFQRVVRSRPDRPEPPAAPIANLIPAPSAPVEMTADTTETGAHDEPTRA